MFSSHIARSLAGAVLGSLLTISLAPGQNVAKIVGGTRSTSPYPWLTTQITAGQAPAGAQQCGGTLIHPNWVLTAAHCAEDRTPGDIYLLIGATDLRRDGIVVGISDIFIHPGYSRSEETGTLYNDVALYELERPVTEVPSLPLVDFAGDLSPGVSSRVIGFGTTRSGANNLPLVLREVDVPLVSLAKAKFYNDLNFTHLAAGLAKGGQDSCQGDSGGPLIIKRDGKWMLGGVVSFGVECAIPEGYGIYADVNHFKKWIAQTTGQPVLDDHSNTTSRATPLLPIFGNAGLLNSNSDTDYFKIEVASKGRVTLWSKGNTDVMGTLRSSKGKAIITDDNGGGAPNFLFSADVNAGTFFLEVKGRLGETNGDYQVAYKYEPPVVPQPDIAVARAGTDVPSGGTVAFEPTLLGLQKTLKLDISNPGKAELRLTAAKIEGSGFSITTQPSSKVSVGRSTSIILGYKPSKAGDVSGKLEIPSNDPDENPFKITLTGKGEAPLFDDYGDTMATARQVSVSSTTNGVLNDAFDVDMFQFTLRSSTAITVSTTGETDTKGALLDPSGAQLSQNDDVSETNRNFSITRTLAAGTYFLSVGSVRLGGATSYQLVLNGRAVNSRPIR